MLDAAIDAWMRKDPDPNTRKELASLVAAGQTAVLRDRFAGRVGFGTAGLRALMGAGPTRLNQLVIQEATLGLGRYVLAQKAARNLEMLAPANSAFAATAVIGFDARHLSRPWASIAAQVLCALGFQVNLFDDEIPTPVAGFAVRRLKADVGIVITASHNPPGYNGYKVYWHNGAQIIGPHDSGIAKAIDAASKAPLLPLEPLAQLRHSGVVQSLGSAMESAYIDGIFALLGSMEAPSGPPLKVAYTPLHGVGERFVQMAAARMPHVRVYTVPLQQAPDGDFPTVRFPNPEEAGAMDLVLAFAQEISADIALANDPDADRLALATRGPDGAYHTWSGNELGALLGDDRMQRAQAGDVVATTIVSSRLLARMAERRGVAYFETLTGFKWIANGAISRQAQGQRLIFGYEEALGFVLGDLVWDKDGICALVAVCALSLRLRAQKTDCLGRLEALYRTFDLHLTQQHTLQMEGAQSAKLGAILRAQPPQRIDDRAVLHIDDLQNPNWQACAPAPCHATEPGVLPPSDVLIYTLDQGARIIVRPSGTEPKIKCYYELRAPIAPDAKMSQARAQHALALQKLCTNHQLQLQAVLHASMPTQPGAPALTPKTSR